jgi:hypothetical protein
MNDLIAQPRAIEEAFRALSARLLAASSATRTLEAWCTQHGIGDGVVRVCLLPLPAEPAVDSKVLDLLCAETNDAPRLRRVALMCGAVTLCEAENWYLPQRLLPAMQHVLDTTDIPFGVVIEPLHPTRRTVQVAFNATELVHHAVVLTGHGKPIAVVHEHYQAALATASKQAPYPTM